MFRRLSIRAKLIIINLTVLVPISIFSYIIISNNLDQSIDRELEEKQELANAVSISLMNYINELWIKEKDISTFITADDNLSDEQINNYLSEILKHQETIQTLTWVSPEGIVLNSSRKEMLGMDLSARDYIVQIQKGKEKCISNVIISVTSGKPIVPITVGIKKNDNLIGIMLMVINIQSLGERFSDFNFNQGDIFRLIDAKGTILYQNDEKDIFLKLKKISIGDPGWKALNGLIHRTKKVSSKLQGPKQMCVEYPVREIGWGLTISSQYNVVLKDDYNELKYWYTTLSLLIVIFIAVAFVLSEFIRKPLAKLRDTARILADGDYSVRTNITGYDEIAATAAVIDVMAESLSQKIADLNAKKSELELSNKGLKEAKIEAETANLSQRMFLAHMSHEIRTPLNGIIGLEDILSRTELSEKQRSYLAKMRQVSKLLLGIINDILDYSKIKSANLRIDGIPFHLLKIVDEAISIISINAEEKGIVIKRSVAENVPMIIKGDPLRLNQVLINILGNAVKFTDHGFIELYIDSEGDKNYSTLTFCIKDTGCGISEENLQKMFEPFIQENSNNRNNSGTGLGLAICKELVKMMGGTITLESELGKGTTVRFTMKTENPEPDVSGDLSLPINYDVNKRDTNYEDTKKVKVLLVEDNQINIVVAKELFSFDYISIDVAENGIQALKLLEKQPYDIIFMDCQMPVLDGYKTTKAIRQREGNRKHIPIIAMTAYAFPDEKEKCLEAGMDDHLAKPYTRDDIHKILQKYVYKYETSSRERNME